MKRPCIAPSGLQDSAACLDPTNIAPSSLKELAEKGKLAYFF